MKTLLDTDIFSEIIKGKDANVLARAEQYQPLMPPWVEREVVAAYLLDAKGAWKWLAKG